MKRMVFPLITQRDALLPIYLKSVGWWENQEPIHRENGYPDYHWLMGISGTGKLIMGNKEYLIEPGYGFFLLPGDPHSYYAVKEPWEVRWLTFHGRDLGATLPVLGISASGVYEIKEPESLTEIMQKILVTAQAENEQTALQTSLFVYEFLITLVKKGNLQKSGSNLDYGRIQPVIEHIGLHYCEDLSLQGLAEIINVTPQYLCLLFRNIVNERPYEYLIKFRLNKAKELLLRNRGMKVKEICLAVGFRDFSHFCAVFKAHEGITPGEFRRIV